MRTSIRKATAADAAGVLECLRLAFEPYRERYTPAGYADTVVGPQNIERRLAAMTVLVATARDGEVIGTIGFQRLPTGDGHIRGMAVLPSRHGSGVAQQLLDAALEGLRRLGCRRATLDTTEPLARAIRFYERNGFRRSGHIGDFFGMLLFEYVKEIVMLKVERKEAILLLTLDRAEKRNALHPQLIDELSNALSEADRDESIRGIVVTGAGTSFCAGLDLAHLLTLDATGKAEYVSAFFALFRRISAAKQPVIAAVNGPAWAGGFDLAAACDLRLCSPQATFAQPEVVLGLTQMMYPVYKVIGLGRARELALTGEPIDANEAHRIGLVSRVCRTEHVADAAVRLAQQLASRPKEALFATKRLSHELIELNAESAFTRMLDVIRERLGSDEHRAALEQYVARRTSR